VTFLAGTAFLVAPAFEAFLVSSSLLSSESLLETSFFLLATVFYLSSFLADLAGAALVELALEVALGLFWPTCWVLAAVFLALSLSESLSSDSYIVLEKTLFNTYRRSIWNGFLNLFGGSLLSINFVLLGSFDELLFLEGKVLFFLFLISLLGFISINLWQNG
jgi:hypothetical protein